MRAVLPVSAAFCTFVFLAQVSSAQKAAPAKPLDYEMFKTRVQPIFLAKREGHARCVSCHQGRTGFALAPLAPGAKGWTEEQTRQNFAIASEFVSAGQPEASRLLMHPLSPEAGGDPFHSGGRQFSSRDAAEWKTLAAWVATGTPAPESAEPKLDFKFYRARVEPIFLNPRRGGGAAGGGVACFACHTVMATPMKLQPLAPGAKTWTEEQSRQNFEVVSKLVVPGRPTKSRLLLQPLATDAGGTARHTGGKYWQSQGDPEFQAMADWVSRETE